MGNRFDICVLEVGKEASFLKLITVLIIHVFSRRYTDFC